MNIKLIIFLVLLIGGAVYLVLPKTKFAKKLKNNIILFYMVNSLGIIFGLLGLIVAIFYPEVIIRKHYFELILVPVLFAYLYSSMLQRVKGPKSIFDEKQKHNMTQAAALTWIVSIFVVFLLYIVYREGILFGFSFFPIYIFFSFTFYSASTLYFFRKN